MAVLVPDTRGSYSEGRPIIADVRDVTKSAGSGFRLRDVSISIRAGVTAIVGYSGAGKTSLLNLLAGFENPDRGSVVRTTDAGIRGAANSRLPLFWAPQGGGLWPHLTVEQHLNAVVPAENGVVSGESGISGRPPKFGQSPNSSDELLAAMDLEHRRQAIPGELSQGERSRLAVARALASRATLLLLDEPLAHVDLVRKPQYWRVIRSQIVAEGNSVVFASHEPDAVIRESTNVICLRDGKVVYSGSTRTLYDHPPDRTSGEFLGRLNWFESGEASDWLSAGGGSAAGDSSGAFREGGLRPERLRLQSDPLSSLELVSTVFSGGCSESVLRKSDGDRIRTLIHGSPGENLSPGQRVRVVLV